MAHVRKHPVSGRWQVRYRDPSGRERSRTFRIKPDAKKFAAMVEADVVRGDYIDPRLGKVTVAEMAERWSATRRHLARATRDLDEYVLGAVVLPVFGARPVASVRLSEVAAWLSGLGHLAPSTQAKALQKLSAVLQLAVADGALKSNPCTGIERPSQRPRREGRALTDVEVAALITAAEDVDEAKAAMVWVMAHAGLRVGEALALRRGDLGDGMLDVRASMSKQGEVRPVKGRDGIGRRIPIDTALEERLRRHLGAQKVAAIDGWMFTTKRGTPVRYATWRGRQWQRIVAGANVGDVNPHDLRHTRATNLFVRDGWTVPQVQAYLGHTDPTLVLKVYTHISADELPRPVPRGHLADTQGI